MYSSSTIQFTSYFQVFIRTILFPQPPMKKTSAFWLTSSYALPGDGIENIPSSPSFPKKIICFLSLNQTRLPSIYHLLGIELNMLSRYYVAYPKRAIMDMVFEWERDPPSQTFGQRTEKTPSQTKEYPLIATTTVLSIARR